MRASAMIRDITIKAETVGVTEAASAASKLGAAVDGATAANDTFSKSTLSVDKALDRMRRQIDESYRQSRQFEAGQRTLDRALEASRITTVEYERDLALLHSRFGASSGASGLAAKAADETARSFDAAARANDNFKRATEATLKSTGLARHELINLSRQVQDVATMFAMGAPPMQIFASQASQIFDIFSSSQGTVGGFFKQLTSGIARFATSGAGLATGAGLLGTGMIYSAVQYADGQRTVETALSGVGRASGATLDGINRLAEAEAAAAKVSVSSARDIAAAYASTGKVDPTRVTGLVGFTKQFAAQRGLGLEDAAKELSASFADPLRGMTDLQSKLGGLSAASKEWIESLAVSGNRLGAQNALVQVFSQSVQGATERTGFWSQTMGNMGRFFGNVSDGVGKLVIGTKSFSDQLADLEQKRALFASLGENALGAKNQIAQMDAQIQRLRAIVELERQRQQIEGKTAAFNASLNADEIVRGMDSRIDNLKRWGEQFSKLDEAIKLNPGAAELPQWTAARDAYANAIKRSATEAEYERKVGELNVRGINARTVAEREAVAVDRERLEISRGVVNIETERVRLLNRSAEVQAQATREARDALKVSRDQLALAGKSPGERFRLEQEQVRRDNIERFGSGVSALPQTTAAAQGLDAAFAATLKRMVAEIPGLSITSGFRTYEQQARLYAEKPGWAARPGTSNHEKGVAADIAYKGSGQIPSWLRDKIAADYGVSFPLANRAVRPEPWHIEPNGGRSASGVARGGAADEIYRNAFTARERDLADNVVGAANRELERQNELLSLSRSAFGQSAAEIARAAKEQELINALTREGININPELRARILSTAQGYGELAQKREDLGKLQDTMRDFNDLGRDALKGFISDLRSGKSAAEALQNALDRVLDKMLDMAINALFDFGGKSGGGLLGYVMRGVTASANGNVFDGAGVQRFALGGAFTNGIVDRPTLFPFAKGIGLMGEAGPEAIMPLRRGSDGRLGVSAPNYRMPPHVTPTPASGGGAMQVGVQINNNSSGQVQGKAKVERQPDGSTNVIVELADVVEAMIADRAASGRSPLNDVYQRDARTMKG